MFYGVLRHSCFFDPALKSAVEQYKYHLHELIALDFKKPTAFIKSAEEEIRRLNPKKKDDEVKLIRLRGMVDERKKTLETLKKRRAALTEELGYIARYTRDNLVKINSRCEASIVVLVDLQIARNEENRLIEDIKTRFKEDLKNLLHHGPVTRQHLEAVKKDVAMLSKEISVLLREDVYTLTRLYEAIHDHTKKIARKIDALMAEIERKKNKRFEEDGKLFAQVEQVLVSLMSDHHFELKATEIRTETAHESILFEKRKEMLDHLFELLQKERRSSNNRRAGEDRRRFNDPDYKGTKRRSGKDRRSGKSRRKSLNLSSRDIT
jgi:hypothetical protein